MAFGQNPGSSYLVAAFGSCPSVSVLVPVFPFAHWTQRAVTLRSSSGCYCMSQVFRTFHCHTVLTPPKIILAMSVNIHSSLVGRVSRERKDGEKFLKAEGHLAAGRGPQDSPIHSLYEGACIFQK